VQPKSQPSQAAHTHARESNRGNELANSSVTFHFFSFLTSGPHCHITIVFKFQRRDNARTTLRFQFLCISSPIDFGRFKPPFDAPILPT
jgi:hypothetical protein